jgi:two-component system response regulator GlrR
MTSLISRDLTSQQLSVAQAVAAHAGWSLYDNSKSTSWLSLLESESVPMVLLSAGSPSTREDITSIRRIEPSTPIFVWQADTDIRSSMDLIQAGATDLIPCNASPQPLERQLKLLNKSPTICQEALCTRSLHSKVLASSIERLALNENDILITGPSGSGKELCASLIHKMSRRANKPMTVLNCPALPVDLADAELFGHVKNAFTGAAREKPGLIREAEGGVLLLDEVSALPLALQAKLLRVIQEREVRPVGARTNVKVDIRILSTTNQDLPALVDAGQFREDLLYRLSVHTLRVPSLRERSTDIAGLAAKFVDEFNTNDRVRQVQFDADCIAPLAANPWPGNVRQLRSVIRTAAALADQRRINPLAIEQAMDKRNGYSIEKQLNLGLTCDEPLEDYLRTTLLRCGNDYPRAAAIAGIHISSFYRLMPPEKFLITPRHARPFKTQSNAQTNYTSE